MYMTACFQKMYSFSFSISPVQLTQSIFTDRDLIDSKRFIDERTNELRLLMKANLHGMYTDAEKKIWLRSVQLQLVGLSDDLNCYLCRDNKIWETFSCRTQIRQTYLYCIDNIENLIGYAKYYFLDWFDSKVKLTDLRRKIQLPGIRCKVNQLEEFLKSTSVKDDLSKLVIQQLRSVLKGRYFSSEQAKYIDQLSNHIQMQGNLNDKLLMGILVDFNFNSPELFLYRSNEINESLDTEDSLHDQHALILKNLDSFRSMELDDVCLDHTWPSIGFHLLKFCEKKLVVLEKMMEARRMAMQDKSMIKSTFRALTGLSVAQLALFVKGQMETGMLLNQKVKDVANFVALNFYTENAEFISVDSFIKKMTDAEFSTALKLWEFLELIQDWLNDKYKVKAHLGLR